MVKYLKEFAFAVLAGMAISIVQRRAFNGACI